MFDRKYFQKSQRKVLKMSHRNKASQYKWLFHLSDAKTFWKMYTLTQFSRKSYLCCGRYYVNSAAQAVRSVRSHALIHLDLDLQLSTRNVNIQFPNERFITAAQSEHVKWLTGSLNFRMRQLGIISYDTIRRWVSLLFSRGNISQMIIPPKPWRGAYHLANIPEWK